MRILIIAALLSAGCITALHVPKALRSPYASSVSISGVRLLPNRIFCASASDDDFVNDAICEDKFDEFLDALTAEPVNQEPVDLHMDNAKKETSVEKDSSHFIQRQQAVGIGGSSGFTYDVNALKRNLVQESVRGCKQELLTLLGDGREYSNVKDVKAQQRPISIPTNRRERDELIEERLASLVQVSTMH